MESSREELSWCWKSSGLWVMRPDSVRILMSCSAMATSFNKDHRCSHTSSRLERCPLAGLPKSCSLRGEDLLLGWMRGWSAGRQGTLQNPEVQLVEERLCLLD